jgi:hypothetical protein
MQPGSPLKHGILTGFKRIWERATFASHYTVSHRQDGVVPFETRYDGIFEFTFDNALNMLAVFANPDR